MDEQKINLAQNNIFQNYSTIILCKGLILFKIPMAQNSKDNYWQLRRAKRDYHDMTQHHAKRFDKNNKEQ